MKIGRGGVAPGRLGVISYGESARVVGIGNKEISRGVCSAALWMNEWMGTNVLGRRKE